MHSPSKLRRRRRDGFTLLELLIVLAILGVLAAMAVPYFLGQQQQANIKATRTAIENLSNAVKLYAVDNDGLPPEGDQDIIFELTQSREKDGQTLKPVIEKVPKDAWGETLFYEYPTSKTSNELPAIWSSGPNRQDENGSGDDINNWSDSEV